MFSRIELSGTTELPLVPAPTAGFTRHVERLTINNIDSATNVFEIRIENIVDPEVNELSSKSDPIYWSPVTESISLASGEMVVVRGLTIRENQRVVVYMAAAATTTEPHADANFFDEPQ